MRAHSLGFHLETVGWERVIPSFGRPQELINRELELADLVVVLFWNRIGSASSKSSSRTGTIEEYELARRLYNQTGRPLVWVYFRKPTVESGEQRGGVKAFRAAIEEEKDLFFREYESIEDFEEMFRQHLVAYLDGMHRWNIDRQYRWMRPDQRILHGDFLAEGVYTFGTTMKLMVDLDGDGNDEEVMFENRHGAFSLHVRRYGTEVRLKIPVEFEPFRENTADFDPKIHHLAIKDVTNDGLPEILLAAYDGGIALKVAVYGFNSPSARSQRELNSGTFSMLQLLEGGQLRAHVREGGTIVLPYGTAGLAWMCKWNGTAFDCSDERGG